MAVTGRQESYTYRILKPAIYESAMAKFIRARSRALSQASRFFEPATVRPILFQAPGPSNQNRAMSVWSGVRTVLTRPPTALISLKSRVEVRLGRAGGPGSQSCEDESKVNGVTLPHPGSTEGE